MLLGLHVALQITTPPCYPRLSQDCSTGAGKKRVLVPVARGASTRSNLFLAIAHARMLRSFGYD